LHESVFAVREELALEGVDTSRGRLGMDLWNALPQRHRRADGPASQSVVPQPACVQLWQGFHSPANRCELAGRLEQVTLPKKGRRSQADTTRETDPAFVQARRQHSAVESGINALEAHGLDYLSVEVAAPLREGWLAVTGSDPDLPDFSFLINPDAQLHRGTADFTVFIQHLLLTAYDLDFLGHF